MFKTTLLIIISFHLSGVLSSLAPRNLVQVYERATTSDVPTSTTKTSNHSVTATSTSTSTPTCVPTTGVYKKHLLSFDDLNAPTLPPRGYNYLSFHPSMLVIRNHSFPQASLPNVLFKPQNGTARIRSVSPCELFDILSLKIILLARPGGSAGVSTRSQYFVNVTGTKFGGQKVIYSTAVRTSVMGEVSLGKPHDMMGLVDIRFDGKGAMAIDDMWVGRYDGSNWD